MNIQNLQQKNGWQRIKQWLFAWKSNKLLTKSIESSLCDYSDAYILVTGDIAVTWNIAAASNNLLQIKQSLAAATEVAFKNCALFKDCRTEINKTFVDYAHFINTAMPVYNLIEYNDNYSDS